MLEARMERSPAKHVSPSVFARAPKILTLIHHGARPVGGSCPGCWTIYYRLPEAEHTQTISDPGWLYAECTVCGERRRVKIVDPQAH
jgi:hypothetical protein